MQIANIPNAAGCCSNLCSASARGINWVGQNLKTAGVAVWESLKKASTYVAGFFSMLGKYLYQGALLIKGAVVHGLHVLKSYVNHHPREIKIAAISVGIGMAIAALISHLCCRAAPVDQQISVTIREQTLAASQPEEPINPSHLANT